MRQKKKKKLGVAVVLLANVFFGGGKCPNLGVVNVRILGVVNVLLANDSQSFQILNFDFRKKEDQVAQIGVREGGGVRGFWQCPKENVFFSLMSSLLGLMKR